MNSAPQDAREIFLAAIEDYEPEQWAEYLDEVCGDADLRRRVELLLEAHVGDESLLDRPVVAPPATVELPITEGLGTQIGPYKLLQQIGEGGMGLVFMAEQHEPVKRRVAIKIIKPGMDTRQVIARFEVERQALAMMDHPNIAKVLDAGQTESGRPYFVMELVNGISVTKYCDEQRLTLDERLRLFLPFCEAVQHAHQKGIIHRDLKPSNMLVAHYDGRAVPKIIDFGVAKATSHSLTNKTMFTELGQVVGTLEYMAPEQAQRNQLDVDTRCDVYSLGIVLYEMFAGDTPFGRARLHSAALDEILRIIREEEPPRPSTKLSDGNSLASVAASCRTEPKKLTRLLRGELDWIVLKALEKDRARRYSTAIALADDIIHYLNREPIAARPPSKWYAARKFVSRNRRLVTLLTVVALALVIAISATVSSMNWIARDRAVAQALRTGQLTQILEQVDQLVSKGQWFEALQVAGRFEVVLEAGPADADVELRARRTLEGAELVNRLEELWLRQQSRAVEGGSVRFDQDDREYEAFFREAGVDFTLVSVETIETRLRVYPQAILAQFASGLTDWAARRVVRQQVNASPTSWKPLIELADRIDPDPGRRRLRALIRPEGWDVEELNELADSRLGDEFDSTLATGTAEILREGVGLDAAAKFLIKACYRDPESVRIHSMLADLYTDFDPAQPAEMVRHDLVTVALRPKSYACWNDLGLSLRLNDELEESVFCHRRAIELDPKRPESYVNLGGALHRLDRGGEAIAVYRKGLELNPKFPVLHSSLGLGLWALGERSEALDAMRQAVSLGDTDAFVDFGSMLAQLGRRSEAIEYFQKAIALDAKTDVLAKSHWYLGYALHEEGRSDEALTHLFKAAEIRPTDFQYRLVLCRILTQAGRMSDVIAQWRQMSRVAGENPRVLNELAWALANVQDPALRDADTAVKLARRAVLLDPRPGHVDTLSVAAYRSGQLWDALQARKAMMDITDGGECRDRLWLALIYAADGRVAEARRWYQEALEQFNELPSPDEEIQRLKTEAEKALEQPSRR